MSSRSLTKQEKNDVARSVAFRQIPMMDILGFGANVMMFLTQSKDTLDN
jgi:hypothetical protein